MLCCLLFIMLFAQVSAFLGRGRAWLGRTPQRIAEVLKGVAGGMLWRRRGMMILSIHLATASVIILNWQHLVHEARTVVRSFDRTPLPGTICSSSSSVVHAIAVQSPAR